MISSASALCHLMLAVIVLGATVAAVMFLPVMLAVLLACWLVDRAGQAIVNTLFWAARKAGVRR